MASTSIEGAVDPLTGVDHILIIDNGAHNIRIASVPYPFPASTLSSATAASSSASSSSSSSDPHIDSNLLAQQIAIEVYPNAIARTRSPHTIPASTSPTAPTPGSKTSIFVSSHIHALLDDYAALHLRLPHQSGVVVDWAAQKTIWDHVLTNHLAKLEGEVETGKKKKGGGKLLAGKAVIITEAYNNLEPAQHATDLLLFEQYGAQAVWRTNGANLVGLGSDVFRSEVAQQVSLVAQAAQEPFTAAAIAEESTESTSSGPSPAKRMRTARTSTTNTTSTDTPSIPRILTSLRPQCTLILDLGYSFCHAIPLISGTPHYPSIRRIELGGKMLINLLKETLSFQQLDMMDESWLMSHIFARTSFVAAKVGERVYGSDDKLRGELDRIREREAAEWSYNDLLLLDKYASKKKGKGFEGKSISVTWSLPDYGGSATTKGGKEARDRARYGFIIDGPNPPPYQPHTTSSSPPKRQKLDPLLEWESSFIATSSSPHQSSTSTSPSSNPTSSSSSDSSENEAEEDQQTLTLTSERYSIIEHLFNPSSLSLDQSPLPELVQASISSVCESVSRSVGDLMWSNIVLIGGLSNAVGMRRRLIAELRPFAPADVPLRIWPDVERAMEEDASLTAIKGGVGFACQVSAREAVRREISNEDGGKPRAAGGKKKKARTSKAFDKDGEEDVAKARWLTYAKYMNPVSGTGSAGEGDLVRAANIHFYPPLSSGPPSNPSHTA
ncbi:related to ARP6 - Actin-related protein [Ustilago trichophora]|uniref:Related to ARP6 - Actin-related protein n=1 Tax=Ustilago trichophora TaxID=86804 RepID=A0A5C3EBW5_9BASI|nr:related to ARP6 - Actin-related protein [Ustilago trichophora]